MIKLGIDIVDLKDPQLKERNERALQLILNPKDELIDHPQLYWLLWSAKEAIFKSEREAINFSPSSIPVKLSKNGETIVFSSQKSEGIIEVTEQYILAICSHEGTKVIHEAIATDTIATSQDVRAYIVDYFKNKGLEYTVGADDLNLPTILPQNVPISISHHRHWSAFAYPESITE